MHKPAFDTRAMAFGKAVQECVRACGGASTIRSKRFGLFACHAFPHSHLLAELVLKDLGLRLLARTHTRTHARTHARD